MSYGCSTLYFLIALNITGKKKEHAVLVLHLAGTKVITFFKTLSGITNINRQYFTVIQYSLG